MKRRNLHVQPEHTHLGLRAFVQAELQMSEAATQQLVQNGAVYRAGRRCQDGEARLRPGDVISVVLEESGRAGTDVRSATTTVPVILFEDEWLMAVAKPAGLPAQPTPGGTEDSLSQWATRSMGREAGLVHRLDRDTSGLMLFGKSRSATSALAAAFREGTVHKRYLAVVEPGLSASGTVNLPISKDPSRPGRYRASDKAHGLSALTDYRVLGGAPGFELVALFPQTGRTHQLRAHLTALGHPIAGDRKYSGAANLGTTPVGRCLLHAHGVLLPHPQTGEPFTLVAPLPSDMAPFFAAAGQVPPEDFSSRAPGTS